MQVEADEGQSVDIRLESEVVKVISSSRNINWVNSWHYISHHVTNTYRQYLRHTEKKKNPLKPLGAAKAEES